MPWTALAIAAGATPVIALCLGMGIIPLNGAGVIHDRGREHRGSGRDLLGRQIGLPETHGRDNNPTARRGLTLPVRGGWASNWGAAQTERTLQRAPAPMPSARLRAAVITAVGADQAAGMNASDRFRAGGSARP